MELIRALRLNQTPGPPRIAFVGSGGKTTALFQTARQFAGPVLLTATTHLALYQLSWADRHLVAAEPVLAQLDARLPPGVTLITGPKAADSQRADGVSDRFLDRIHALAEAHQVPLLVEADGSRQRPLKAPAIHEPAVPAFVDQVVVLSGLSGLEKPLSSEWVHRSERFAALSGIELGEPVTARALTDLLTHPQGGLKNIPDGARRTALLNQADTPQQQAQAAALASDLLPQFQSVITASLAPEAESVPPPSPGTNPRSSIFAVHERAAAVILAAGSSSRFGSPKQLLPWHGLPLVWHAAHKAVSAGLDPVVVVCGDQLEAIQSVLEGLPVHLVHNAHWERGQGTSVCLGAQSIPADHGAVLFLLADQPQVPPPLIQALRARHAQTLNPIIGPLINGQRGNPVLFDRLTFPHLAALSGPVGGRELFSKYPVDWIPWHGSEALLDVDTPQDYDLLLEMPL